MLRPTHHRPSRRPNQRHRRADATAVPPPSPPGPSHCPCHGPALEPRRHPSQHPSRRRAMRTACGCALWSGGGHAASRRHCRADTAARATPLPEQRHRGGGHAASVLTQLPRSVPELGARAGRAIGRVAVRHTRAGRAARGGPGDSSAGAPGGGGQTAAARVVARRVAERRLGSGGALAWAGQQTRAIPHATHGQRAPRRAHCFWRAFFLWACARVPGIRVVISVLRAHGRLACLSCDCLASRACRIRIVAVFAQNLCL